MENKILDMVNEKLTSICIQVTTLREDVAGLKADMRWLTRGYWLLAGAIVGTVGSYFLFV